MLYPHRVSYPGFQVRNRSRLSSYTLRLYFAQGCTKYMVDASALCVPIDVVSLTAPAPAARSSCRQPPNCRLLHATVDRSWAGRVSCAGRRSSKRAASIHAVGDGAGSAHARRGPPKAHVATRHHAAGDLHTTEGPVAVANPDRNPGLITRGTAPGLRDDRRSLSRLPTPSRFIAGGTHQTRATVKVRTFGHSSL